MGQRIKVSVFASWKLVSLYQTIHLGTFKLTLFSKEDSNLLGNSFMQAQSKTTPNQPYLDNSNPDNHL